MTLQLSTSRGSQQIGIFNWAIWHKVYTHHLGLSMHFAFRKWKWRTKKITAVRKETFSLSSWFSLYMDSIFSFCPFSILRISSSISICLSRSFVGIRIIRKIRSIPQLNSLIEKFSFQVQLNSYHLFLILWGKFILLDCPSRRLQVKRICKSEVSVCKRKGASKGMGSFKK